MITQRVIVPGGRDMVTSPPMSRTAFERLKPGVEIKVLGAPSPVLRIDCFWDERHDTISLWPENARVLKLID